ncbi:unnamed protein product [Medioppia subpectinata]|uniref:Angiotensin-converting enzyme n=1 Tax=Medioppia subpectinata TaxID=1979941 RepID=A0A7R9KS49_9ACAR|nr:unnamed protein product [Medioppia subpectinata]CAG2107601.1 unnamed protein product [Medioppia subpectinata]
MVGFTMNIAIYVSVIALLSTRIECKHKDKSIITDENKAVKYLKDVNERMAQEYEKYSEVQWDYMTDMNNHTLEAQTKASELFSEFQKKQAIDTKQYNWTHFSEYNRRQFERLALIGTAALSEKDTKMFINVSTEMEAIYSSAKICVSNKCDLELDPDLEKLMAESKDYDQLLEAWVKWRDASGKQMREKYIKYYTLGNKAAKLNKVLDKEFKTLDDIWLYGWETEDIKKQMSKALDKLLPFYRKLHTYMRLKLEKTFAGKMPKDRTIPAHLLGNMWAQQWANTMKTVPGVDPFPNLAQIDVTDEMKKQKYTAEKMFKLSEQFFVDLGFDAMTDKFWNNHASAWDFYTSDDFRIKQCTDIDMEDLITIHHEMGHIEYYMQYREQPAVYREGANPGFHEAIGDLIALSVATPKHLNKTGLLTIDNSMNMNDMNIKFQLKMALEKVVFMPFAYIVDKWRWDVFSGKVSANHMNEHWWHLRGKYQGISPPVKRSERDFDPGAKYHVPSGVEYIRYFAAHILQFQFHKALCSISQSHVSLHECDIDGDKEAGKRLKHMLSFGASKKWPQLLKELTGTEEMDVKPMLEYFQPLQQFLDNELKGYQENDLKWDFDVNHYFKSSANGFNSIQLLSAKQFLQFLKNGMSLFVAINELFA